MVVSTHAMPPTAMARPNRTNRARYLRVVRFIGDCGKLGLIRVESPGGVDASLQCLDSARRSLFERVGCFGPEVRGRGSVSEIELEFYPSHHDVPTFGVKIPCTGIVICRPIRFAEPVAQAP